MNPLARGLAAAALCLLAPVASAKKARDAAADLAVMKTLPVYLIIPEAPLRGTTPLITGSKDPAASKQAAGRAYRRYDKMFAFASNSVIGEMFTGNRAQARALNLSVPGMRTLRAAGCLVDEGDAVAQSIANLVREAPGLGDARFVRAESHEAIRDIPRIEVLAVSSITPDFAAIITTYTLEVYSPDMPGAPHSWKARPTVDHDFAIVSDGIDPPRLEGAELDALPPEDEDNDGAPDKWKLAAAAARRARQWADGSCHRVQEALRTNHAEARRLFALALAGQAPTDLPDDYGPGSMMKPIQRNLPTDPAELTQRHLYHDVGWRHGYGKDITVSRRAGDDVMIDFRFAWAPDDRGDAYDRMREAAAGEAAKAH
jgi:hypothetical protein